MVRAPGRKRRLKRPGTGEYVAFGVAVASLHLKGGPERNRSGAARRAAQRYLQHINANAATNDVAIVFLRKTFALTHPAISP